MAIAPLRRMGTVYFLFRTIPGGIDLPGLLSSHD
jgi:hypothetical protein